jgi:hypothetical protein
MRAPLLIALVLVLPVHAQDDEHALMPPLPTSLFPRAAPWYTGTQLLRQLERHDAGAVQYLQGAYDATEHREWCRLSPAAVPLPRPAPPALAAEVRAALAALPPKQLKRSAGELVLEIWQNKFPCPTVDGTGCCP